MDLKINTPILHHSNLQNVTYEAFKKFKPLKQGGLS
jgi:hypothetical protein